MARFRAPPALRRLAAAALAVTVSLFVAQSALAGPPAPGVTTTKTLAQCKLDAFGPSASPTAVQLANKQGISGSAVHMTLFSPDGLQTYFSEVEQAQIFCNLPSNPYWVSGEQLTIRATAAGSPTPSTAADPNFFVACGPTPAAASTNWFNGQKTCVSDTTTGNVYFRIASLVDNLDPANTGSDVAAHIEFLVVGSSTTTTGGIDAVECNTNPFACNGAPPPGEDPTPELDSIVLFGAGALMLGGLFVKRRRGSRAQ